MPESDSLEDTLSEIGFGRWQLLTLVAAVLSQAICPTQQIGAPLISAPLPFRCSYPDFLTDAAYLINTTGTEFDNLPFLEEPGSIKYPSQCLPVMNLEYLRKEFPAGDSVRVSNTERMVTGLPSCPEIEYDTSIFQSTIISEWHLVCENSVLRPIYQMTYSFGSILASMYCGQLSDWLGRKRALQIGGMLYVISAVGMPLVPWYSVMIATRIISGMAAIAMYFPLYTLLSEVSPPRRRTLLSMLPGIVYFCGMVAFAGIAYAVPDWRKLLLFCNLPLLILVPMTFFLDESPRWLLQKGRADEAVELLRKGAEKNGATFSPSTLSTLRQLKEVTPDVSSVKFKEKGTQDESDHKNHGTLRMVRTCFSSPGIRIIMLITPLLWFLMRCLYTGIVLNANNFTSSNPIEYIAVSGLMGLIGNLLSVPLSLILSRKLYMAGTLSIGGAFVLLELVIPTNLWWFKWGLVMVAFSLACGAFQVNYVYAAELFPTVIRTRGFSYTNFIASVGEMSVPLVTDFLVLYQTWAPSVTFGLAGIIGGLLLPLLPETKNRPMPETLQDAEDRYWYDYKGLQRNSTSTEGKETSQVESSD